jgi:hypothetical protein
MVMLLIIVSTIHIALVFTYKTTYYIYNVVEERNKESNRWILLKLYGIGLIILIIFGGFSAIIFYKYGSSIMKMYEPKALDLPFYDDFDNYPVGVYPYANGWSKIFTKSTARVSDDQAHSGENSFKLYVTKGTTSQHYVKINQPERFSYKFYVYLPNRNDVFGGFSYLIRPTDSRVANYVTFTPDGSIWFRGKEWKFIQKYFTQRWYKVQVDLDYSKNTAEVSIDDGFRFDNIDIYPREYNDSKFGQIVLDQFTLSVGGLEPIEGAAYFDDVFLSGSNPKDRLS